MLRHFLDKHRVYEGDFTHTGMKAPVNGSYNISDDLVPEFHKLYTDAMNNGELLSLTEKHKSFSPILVDLDLVFPLDIGLQRKLNDKNIDAIYKMFLYVFGIFFGESIGDNLKDVYIFMKPSPIVCNGNIKDGVHMIFPDMVIDTKIQLKIRERVVGMCIDSGIFSIIGCKNEAKDIVDEAVVARNNWLMYGSSKCPPANIYTMTRHMSFKNEAVIDNKIEVIDDPVSFFSIRRCKSEIGYTLEQDVSNEEPEYRASANVSDLFVAKNLIGMLSKERADTYAPWIEVGFCAHNVNASGLLHAWIEFSRQGISFKEGECEKIWKGFKKEGLNIGSLHRWARLDDEPRYKAFIREHCKNDLIESLSGTEYDVAKLLYSQYRYDYVCADHKKNIWYKFENHRWRAIQCAIDLKNILSIDLSMQYTQLGMSYKRKLIDAEDDGKKKELEGRIKHCETMRNQVKTTRFKGNVIEECKSTFYNNTFEQSLDSRSHLICFENGVYDLNLRKFRDGRPDDYISYSTGIDYIEYDSSNKYVREVEEFIRKVFVDDDIRKYIMTSMSTFLHGEKDHQHFYILTGCGSNGKSTIIDFYEKTLGDYSTPLPISVLTKPRGSSGAAAPEMRVTKGKRVAHMQEPENNDQIYVGYMKELTGGDNIQCRGLYENPITFRPQFSLMLCCNELPLISATDGGTWRRMRVVRFLSKFVDNPNPSSKYEFKKDSSIIKNIHKKEWQEAFASMLIHTYNGYKEKGIVTPESVLTHCREYEKQSNIFLEFIDECLVRLDGTGNKMQISAVYNAFRAWHLDAFGGKPPSRNELKNELEKQFGLMHRTNGWNVFSFRDDD